MKRLFTFGCSFTEYSWPTWANLLSPNFNYFENWGYRGIGNRGIAERVAECCIKNNFTKDDVIIVQWSTHLRNDWYHIHHLPEGRPPGWKTSGSIFTNTNTLLYDEQWVDLFFYEPAYIMHTLNNIKLVQGLLESTGAHWYMTSITDFRDLAIDSTSERYIQPTRTLFEYYPEFKFYDTIWTTYSKNWLTPLYDFSMKNQQDSWYFKDNNNELWKESHLSTRQYKNWILQELGDRLSIPNNRIQELDRLDATIEQTKNLSNSMFEFTDNLGLLECFKEINWPDKVKGL
jgi:hypothetical protein